MTKEEYEAARDKIVSTYGKPEYILNEPENESAKKLMELRTIYLGAIREAKKKAQPPVIEALKATPKEKAKESVLTYLKQPIYVDEKYLKGFEGWERQVVEEYYLDRTVSHSDLAKTFGIDRAKITGLFNSQKFKVLDISLFDILFPLKTRHSLLSLLDAHDSKVTLEAARTLKLIQNEALNVTTVNKPIEDQSAMEMLKKIGDQLVDGNT